MKGNNPGKLAVGFLMLVFVFSLGNLIYNLENLDIEEETIHQFVNPGTEESGVATSGTLTIALRWVYYGFVIVCCAVAAIGAVMFSASKDRKKWRRLIIQMAGMLLVVAAIFAFAYFYDDIEGSLTGTGSTEILPGGGGELEEDGPEPADNPDSLKVVLTFGVFAIIFLFIVIIIMAVSNFMKMRSSGLDYSDMERDSKDVARTIQRTIDALAGGSDTRATVIRCYTDMCKALARHGVEEEEHLTPREFLKLSVEKLPVPEAQMKSLIDVFEEARYSQHELGEQDCKRAVAALESVKKVLVAYRPPLGGESPGV